MSFVDELQPPLSAMPGGADLLEAFTHWLSLPLSGKAVEVVKLFFQLVGAWEFLKYVYRWIFQRRSRLEIHVEVLESLSVERLKQIHALEEEVKRSERARVEEIKRHPETAIAQADKEMRDHNADLAARHLEEWFNHNAQSIGDIALRLARFHIAQALPDPGEHLKRAEQLLRLARGATPNNQEAQDIFNEFSQVNAAIQEQVILHGDELIAWNSSMGRSNSSRGRDPQPLAMTFYNVEAYCSEKGLVRLAPMFAERAADIAHQAGPPLRAVWCQMESFAAWLQNIAGHNAQALERIDWVLAENPTILPARSTVRLLTRFFRAAVLRDLGRPGDALAEIDAFAPIEAEVNGERHPGTLSTRYLRATVLQDLGRSGDALAEIDAFAPIEAEVNGERHPGTLATRSLRIGIDLAMKNNADHKDELISIIAGLTASLGARARSTMFARYRLARQLVASGLTAEAGVELHNLMACFDPATAHSHRLLASAKSLLRFANGGPLADDLIT